MISPKVLGLTLSPDGYYLAPVGNAWYEEYLASVVVPSHDEENGDNNVVVESISKKKKREAKAKAAAERKRKKKSEKHESSKRRKVPKVPKQEEKKDIFLNGGIDDWGTDSENDIPKVATTVVEDNKPKPNAIFMKKLKLSPKLSEFLGCSEESRPQVV